jgi:CubicO group peptidase (beta-lactamase class C family)
MLLRGGTTSTGQRILREDTVQEMTSRQRVGIHDETFQQVIDFGWGVIINSAQYSAGPVPYGFGEHASAETFGHGGAQSSLGLADPAHGLVAVLIANGTPGDAVHQERFHQLTTALYEDLGLARV